MTLALLLKAKSVKTVKINSIPVELEHNNGYIVIQREFYDRDIIEIKIAAELHLAPLQGSDSMAAVMYGSILLAQLGEYTILKGITEGKLHEKIVRLSQEQLA